MMAPMGEHAARPVLSPQIRRVLAGAFLAAVVAPPLNEATRCSLLDAFMLLLVLAAAVPAGGAATFVVIAFRERDVRRAVACALLVGAALFLGTIAGLLVTALLSEVGVVAACTGPLGSR